MASESESEKLLDIMVDGIKVGSVCDGIPTTINTDEECRDCLNKLRMLPLTEEEMQLIDRCLTVVSSSTGDEVEFGIGEIHDLGMLAEKYPEYSNDIIACSHHLDESIEQDGDLPPDIYLRLAKLCGAMGRGLQISTLN